MNHYQILGVDEQACKAEIKKRWRDLAKSLHPDTNPDLGMAEGERLLQINQAYQILCDDDRRAYHDYELAHARWRKRQEGRRTKARSEANLADQVGYSIVRASWGALFGLGLVAVGVVVLVNSVSEE